MRGSDASRSAMSASTFAGPAEQLLRGATVTSDARVVVMPLTRPGESCSDHRPQAGGVDHPPVVEPAPEPLARFEREKILETASESPRQGALCCRA